MLLLNLRSHAQENAKQSLEKILKTLERRFDVSFTYSDENINGVSILPPPSKLDLEESLRHLGQETGLHFQRLSERYIAVSRENTVLLDVCGTIQFDDTGGFVSGATVHTGSNITVTNDQGYFSLQAVRPDSAVHIRYLGYKTMTIPAKDFTLQPCYNIRLIPQAVTLHEISVADFVTTGIDKATDGSFIIHTHKLGILPGLVEPDVLQAIQKLPGIQSINETISNINVRGGTNDQNLMLWDGMKMYQSGHFFGLISAFNPYLTQSVSLIKNGSGSNLGEGVSSTIDIRSDDELTSNFIGSAGINMLNADAFVKVPVSKKLSIHLSARRSIADLVRTPTYDKYFQRAFRGTDVTNSSSADTLAGKREDFRFFDTSLKILYDFSKKDKLRLSFLNVYNAIDYEENAIASDTIASKTSSLEQRNLAAGVTYSRLWNPKIRSSAAIYMSSYELSATNFDISNDQRLLQDNKVLDTGLKLDTRFALSPHLDLFGGYQYFEVGVTNLDDVNNPPFSRMIKKVVRTHAAFLEGNASFNNTTIRLGARGTYYPVFSKFILEPRVAINQNFLEFFTLELLGEMKNQTTTQIIDLQSDFLGVEKRRWVLSNNNDIPIIRSKQASAGVYYKRRNLLLSAEGYYKYVNGIITSSQGFENQFQYVRSSGSYDVIGADFLINTKFDHINTWLSYSYAESNYSFPELIPPSFPNNLDIRHRATFGISYQTKHFELSTGFNWHTGRPQTLPLASDAVIGTNIQYGPPNAARYDDYLRIDISCKYNFNLGAKVRGQLGGSIWNVMNKQNIVNEYFKINDNHQPESVQQLSLGITPNVALRVTF